MKKHGLSLLILILIYSCSKDINDIESPIQADLSGIWTVASYDFEANTSIFEIDEIALTNFTDFFGTAGTMSLTMVFSDSGEYSFNGFYFLSNEIYPNLGQPSFFTDYHTVEEEGTWSLNGNKLDVIVDGEPRRIGISELTNSSLTLRINTGVSDIDENQTTTTTNTQERYVLVRQQ